MGSASTSAPDTSKTDLTTTTGTAIATIATLMNIGGIGQKATRLFAIRCERPELDLSFSVAPEKSYFLVYHITNMLPHQKRRFWGGPPCFLESARCAPELRSGVFPHSQTYRSVQVCSGDKLSMLLSETCTAKRLLNASGAQFQWQRRRVVDL